MLPRGRLKLIVKSISPLSDKNFSMEWKKIAPNDTSPPNVWTEGEKMYAI